MPDRGSIPELILARRDVAGQLAALVATLQRFQAEASPAAGLSERRERAGTELLAGLLRQVLRVLNLIHAAQAPAADLKAAASGPEALSAAGGGFFARLLGGISRGLGLASLALGIINLFRRRRQPETLPIPFEPPASLSLEVANTDQILRGFPRFDFSATGERRIMELPALPLTSAAAPPPAEAAVLLPPVQVTVNVSAMDARSFLDHAPALAQAVREAMLHMHPINQLVRESF